MVYHRHSLRILSRFAIYLFTCTHLLYGQSYKTYRLGGIPLMSVRKISLYYVEILHSIYSCSGTNPPGIHHHSRLNFTMVLENRAMFMQTPRLCDMAFSDPIRFPIRLPLS